MTQDTLRLAAFLSDRTEVFHAIQHRLEVWKADPFDVEAVNAQARATFERMLLRATTPPGTASGRLLLLLGDSGSGKTHLMRAIRSHVHEHSLGFVGYMQMTTSTADHARYFLSNLITSLDQPYAGPDPRSGLRKLSDALLARCGPVAAMLADPEQDPEEVPVLVEGAADDLQRQPAFQRLELDLLRALLYLQRDDPRLRSRVIRYLRCEDLSVSDRKVLSGLVPRTHDTHPQEMVEHLGQLVATLGQSLVLCLDQLEGFDTEATNPQALRRALHLLCDLAERAPSSLIVISCLHSYWTHLREHVTRPLLDRIERDPEPVQLSHLRTAHEARLIVERRLEHLYSLEDAPFDPAEPTWPFPHEGFERLSGLSTRGVLDECRRWREQALRDGALPSRFPLEEEPGRPASAPPPSGADASPLDPAWNDFRSSHAMPPPETDAALLELLQWALEASVDELPSGHRVEVRRQAEALQVEVSPGGERLHVAVCNRSAQGKGLVTQLEQVHEQAQGRVPVVVRTSEFPGNPKTRAATELGRLLTQGGRRAVLEDSDTRLLLALRAFRQQEGSRPDFLAWLRTAQPLTQLKSLRDILALDTPRPTPALSSPTLPPPSSQTSPPLQVHLLAHADVPPAPGQDPRRPALRQSEDASAAPAAPLPPEPPLLPGRTLKPSPTPGVDGVHAPLPRPEAPRTREPMLLGETDSILQEPVLITLEELTRHAAFLGGTGSGKTTLALNVLEQLLLQGVPVLLVDRKGDLAGYASEAFWTQDLDEPRRATRQALLRERVDVALFTPGHPQGRPLAIPIVPEGLGALPDFDRQQATRHAADALAGMLDYRQSPKDKARRTLLTQALDRFVQLHPTRVTLEGLVKFIGDKDPLLVNAVGRLDVKLFGSLADDLDRLRLDARVLMDGTAERLDMELLLGRGAHARPGRTRLSILSTRFLGDTSTVLFWVSQLLLELTRWLNRNPSPSLQAVVLFDEADLYLPAQREPATKQPMENLLKRARSAGLGVMLATQSPGDFDYKCRDTIRAWFIGRVKEKVSLDKMKPMLSEARVDAAKIPGQGTGQFHVARDGRVERIKAAPSALVTEQLPDDELLRLAARTRDLALE